jgi:hypothetical protein
MARYTAAEGIVKKNGLEREYNEELRKMENFLEVARANGSKGFKPGL